MLVPIALRAVALNISLHTNSMNMECWSGRCPHWSSVWFQYILCVVYLAIFDTACYTFVSHYKETNELFVNMWKDYSLLCIIMKHFNQKKYCRYILFGHNVLYIVNASYEQFSFTNYFHPS